MSFAVQAIIPLTIFAVQSEDILSQWETIVFFTVKTIINPLCSPFAENCKKTKGKCEDQRKL